MSQYLIRCRYVNKSGKKSNKAYIYYLDTAKLTMESDYVFNFELSGNGRNQYALYNIINSNGKKDNPIYVENYECLDEDYYYNDLDTKITPVIQEIKFTGDYYNESKKQIIKNNSEHTTDLNESGKEMYITNGTWNIDNDCWNAIPTKDWDTATTATNSNDKCYTKIANTISVNKNLSEIRMEDFDLTMEKFGVDIQTPDGTYKDMYTVLSELRDKWNDSKDSNNIERKEGNMFNKMFKNIEFGKITDGSIKMSIYGPAFRTADGDYIAVSGDEYVDATGFIFDGMDNFCFKMPVGEDNVDIGDFIVHNKRYCRIINLDDNGNWIVEDVYNREVKTIMSARSPFGFNFLTKIITFGEELFTPDKENPFGSILPMMMLFDDNSMNKDNSMMMAMMLMNNTNNIDPMMMYLMCGDAKNNKDMLPMLMLMNSKNNPFNIQKPRCNCNKNPKNMTDNEISEQIL